MVSHAIDLFGRGTSCCGVRVLGGFRQCFVVAKESVNLAAAQVLNVAGQSGDSPVETHAHGVLRRPEAFTDLREGEGAPFAKKN